MRAVSKYKAMVDEVGRMMMVFANTNNVSTLAQSWTLADIQKAQADVMNYANTAADQIKDELVGDGDEAKFRGRLKTAFFELGADPYFAPSYFPVFDEALFELPNKDEPYKNRQMLDALTDVFGSDAGKVMLALQVLTQWANFIVREVSKMLDEVCKFVGYTPELQEQAQEATNTDSLAVEQPEPQQTTQELATPEAKELINKAIAANLIEKTPEGLKWKGTKVLCAYFADRASHSLNLSNKMDKEGNITTSWKPFEALFGIDRLKDAKQNWMRLNTKFEPTGYEKVDALM